MRVTAASAQQPEWAAVREQVAALGGSRAVERYAELQVLAVRLPETLPLMLRAAGVTTAAELQTLLVDGDLAAMQRGEGIILGRLVAEQLAVPWVGK